MSSYFSFETRVNINSMSLYTLAIFKADSKFREHEYRDYLEDTTKGSNPIDLILFIVSQNDYEDIKRILTDERISLKDALSRDRKIKKCFLCGFDENGHFSIERVIKIFSNDEYYLDNLEKLQLDLIDSGLSQLCAMNRVEAIAPPGSEFKKPSGKYGKEFIRSSLMQSGDAETYFLAFCLLRYWGELKVDYIYIDTMAISPCIYKLIHLKQQLNRNIEVPKIISFHSYMGVSEIPKKNNERTLVFISASTSGDLSGKIVKQWKIENRRVITFLSYVNPPCGSKLLKKLPKPNYNKHIKEIETSKIEIIGEYFIPKAKKPREIRISSKHKVKLFSQYMSFLHDVNIFSIYKEDYLLYVDPLRFVHCKHFKDWFKKTIFDHAPLCVSHIVYIDDDASKILVNIAFDYYKKYSKKTPVLLTSSELGLLDSEAMSEIGGVLVICAINSRGNRLLSISRDLRNFAPNSMRTYIIGLSISTSSDSFKALESNLVFSPNRSVFKLHNYWNINIGLENNRNPWLLEHELIKNYKYENNEIAKARITLFENADIGLEENCFWPSHAGKNLQLRPDFIYWDFDYSKVSPSAASIFLTMAAILENARSNTELDYSNRLYTDEYQSSLISPECFSRFNDGIIQASILRAAKSSEIDYSSSPDMSLSMKNILIKIIENYMHPRGEALYEFLLALAIDHLKLCQGDMNEIRQKVNNLPINPYLEFFNELLENKVLKSNTVE
jgi:hypothetical protein